MSGPRRQGRGRRAPPARCRARDRPRRRHVAARQAAACAWSPRAIARLGARLQRGSAVISATNGKTTTAAMVAGDPRARRRAPGPQPRRGQHGRRRGHRAAWTARATATPASSRSTSSGSAQVVDELQPRALLLANLFRDQLDRYGELDSIADRWADVAARTSAALVLNADDPTVADLGRDGRARRTSASQDDAMALPGCSTPPTPRTAGAAARPTATTPSTSATSAATTATPAAPRAPSRRSARTTSSSTACAARASRCARRRAKRASRSPCPASTTSTTRSAPRRWRSPSARRSTQVVAGLHAVSPAFGRAETLRVGGRELSILLVKNPAGANEVLRTLALEDGEHDLLAVLNDNIADGRDVRWVWDADFEVLAAARAARRRARHPRRRDGAAPEVRRRRPPTASSSRPSSAPALDRALGGGDGRALRPADLHRDARAARPARRPRRRDGSFDDRTERHLARPRVRRLRRRPAAVARARRAPGLAGARRRRGHRARRAPPRRRGHEVVALDRERELLEALRERAAGLAITPSPPTRATSPSIAASDRRGADADAAAPRRRRNGRARPARTRAARRRPGARARGRRSPRAAGSPSSWIVCIGASDEREAARRCEVARVGPSRDRSPRARSASAASSSRVEVERDDLVAGAGEVERDAPAAGADVEHRAAGSRAAQLAPQRQVGA